MVQVILPYVTKFPSALFFVDEMVKIIHLDLFLRALQKVMFDVINFRGKSKNEQNRKILYTRKFTAAKVRLLTSMDRKTSLHR